MQGVRPPPRDDLRFSSTTGILQKKTMWFIGVEVEQETSAPPPKKNPGSAPEFIYSFSSAALTVNRVIYMPLFSFKQSKFVLIYSGLQSIDISKKNLLTLLENI